VKFYLVAMLFIVFDIETVFLIPWGTIYFGGAAGEREGAKHGVPAGRDAGVHVHSGVGYVYVWKRGALEWD